MTKESDRYTVKTRYLRVNVLALVALVDYAGNGVLTGEPDDRVLNVYYKNSRELNTFSPYGRGGRTIVTVTDNETGNKATGIATCSMKDQFSYKIGREKALERALEQLNG